MAVISSISFFSECNTSPPGASISQSSVDPLDKGQKSIFICILQNNLFLYFKKKFSQKLEDFAAFYHKYRINEKFFTEI
ncbi:MAG: hypothetical protein B6D45_07755 [Ignavibacteriales bacterium UTCHB3]|nr:MAG: hypothetical protein B6D45_07755 [Ignavibacteriales bacterium UTCHB3]